MNAIKWMKYVGIIALCILATGKVAAAKDTEKQKDIASTIEESTLTESYTSIEFHSRILNEQRTVLIHLPEDYNTSKKNYPTTYILDGNRHISHAINAESLLQSEGLMPSSIIVAITNNSGTRGRDLSSGKDNFLNFIKKELMPLVSSKYRVSEIKTLFGHSMAGAFTLNALATQPELFDNYIAASPVIQINNSELLTKYEQLDLTTLTNKSLYLSMGNKAAEGKNAIDALNAYLSIMQKKPDSKFNWYFESFPNQVHMTTPYLTLFSGLTHVFSDYRAPTYSGLVDFQQRGELIGLETYYQKRAEKYSVSAEVPERTMRTLGFSLFDGGHESKGLEILELNLKNHPSSLRAINALAQTFEDVNKPRKALPLYQQALKIAKQTSSRNESHFKRQVERLKSSTN